MIQHLNLLKLNTIKLTLFCLLFSSTILAQNNEGVFITPYFKSCNSARAGFKMYDGNPYGYEKISLLIRATNLIDGSPRTIATGAFCGDVEIIGVNAANGVYGVIFNTPYEYFRIQGDEKAGCPDMIVILGGQVEDGDGGGKVSDSFPAKLTILSANYGYGNSDLNTQSVDNDCSNHERLVKEKILTEVFPNPINDVLNIKLSEDKNLLIKNALNKTMLQTRLSIGQHQVDVSKYTTGMYFVTLIGKEQDREIFKILKL